MLGGVFLPIVAEVRHSFFLQLPLPIMSYPYQRYKLFKKKPCIQHVGGTSTGIVITDRELAKLIEDYCREKVKTLKQELEEL